MKKMIRKMRYHAETVGPRFVIGKMEKEMKKCRILIVSQKTFSRIEISKNS